MIGANEARRARIVAVARLEVIYDDLMKSEDEIKKMKIVAIDEERLFHKHLTESMKVRSELLKRIAIQVGIPRDDVELILKRDPSY